MYLFPVLENDTNHPRNVSLIPNCWNPGGNCVLFRVGRLIYVLHPLFNPRRPVVLTGESSPGRLGGCSAGRTRSSFDSCGATAAPGPGASRGIPAARLRAPPAHGAPSAVGGRLPDPARCPSRPLPAGAPEQSGSRPGLSAAASGSALAGLRSGEGTAGWATRPWESSSGIFAARSNVRAAERCGGLSDVSPEELHLEYYDSKQYNWEMYRCCQRVSRTMGKLADSVESFNCSSKSSLALCFQDHGHSSSACLWNGRTANLKLWAVKLSCEQQQQYQCQQLLL
ncbi:uncharacterized protein LOC116441996 [Corvus moneduloides]|uniref:uncharacterized protein LOC116441996 n=1 Tax=Corvus moneduloides TaxID=1196302 RepID=UPI0013627BCE|nr:uncharacterized protein LOC116441996 [Corvus moneduloides]